MTDSDQTTPDLEELSKSLASALTSLSESVSRVGGQIVSTFSSLNSAVSNVVSSFNHLAAPQGQPTAPARAASLPPLPLPSQATPTAPGSQGTPTPAQEPTDPGKTLQGALAGLAEALGKISGGLASTFGGLTASAGGAGGALSAFTGAVGHVEGIMGGLTSSVSSAGGLFGAMGGAVSGVSSMLGGVLGPAGAAVGKAFGNLIGKVGEAINAVQPFVEALAPGTILLFQDSLRNLQATVGVAFEPIFQVLTGLFQRIGGLILPVMQQLRPVVEQVSNSFASLMLPLVRLLVSSFQGLMPFIKNAADFLSNFVQQLLPVIAIFNLVTLYLNVFKEGLALISKPIILFGELMGVIAEGLADWIDAVSIVFQTLIQTLKSFLPDMSFKDLFAQLAKVLRDVTANFLIFIGTLAKFFGADKFLANLIENLKPKSGEVAAPRNASIGSVEALSKEMATAAATASGSAATEKEKSFADVVKELEKLQSGGDSKFTTLVQKLDVLIELLRTSGRAGFEVAKDAAAGLAGGLPGIISRRLWGR